jgi:signal transduction histidine kinase
MSLRQQQAAVFVGTVVVIFSIFAAGLWLIGQRLTREATLQTALLMARQVEIALADSLRQRPTSQRQSSSFWDFLGNIFPGGPNTQSRAPSRHTEVRGLMRAFIDRSRSIEAMWVFNAEGRVLYSSLGRQPDETLTDPTMKENLRRGVTMVNSRRDGNATYYDVLVPLQMPRGVRGPGGLRLWINPADWTELLSGLWRQLTLLFALGGGVALLSAFLTTALYTRRFRLISETLRQAEAGTYQARPRYASHDEVGASLDLIDRLVMKQRHSSGPPVPLQRLAVAVRTLAHEVRNPLNALAIHLEVLRNGRTADDRQPVTDSPQEKSFSALESGIRQVEQLVRDFTDYAAPVNVQREPLDLSKVLEASLEGIASQCAAQRIELRRELPEGPWPVQGDLTRLRQTFDNLLRNAIEAQPQGGTIQVVGRRNEKELTLEFTDAGPGVPPERRDHLFEYGKTTKTGGSGIGLPLSQLIAEAHGGSLAFEPHDESIGGATFRFRMPLDED